MSDDEPMILQYSSPKNIDMRGEINVDMTVGDWNALSDEERGEVMNDIVWELIEIGPKQ